ncbi:hypothetical protein L218DRAFT_710268 [Marasmius fiardii PR-910]|nr:hypothetical protein L218DRAFT_710268 [Marasmius fiardii PR-910]
MPFDGFSIYATSADSSFFARNRNPLSLGAVTTLPNVLKTITTSHFRRLTLVAHFASDFFLLPNSDAEPEERAVSWKMLDEFLCSLDDQFPNLVIEIIITRPHDPYSEDTEIYTWKRDVERAARHRFRRCDADGKLLVTFSMTGIQVSVSGSTSWQHRHKSLRNLLYDESES